MNFGTLVKGFCMGVCDTVPGISGGTIAFITGIYARLIAAVAGLTSLAKSLFLFMIGRRSKQSLQKTAKNADLGFLATLGAGILIAVLSFSHLISYLLQAHEPLVLAFFLGLIFVSAVHIFTHIETHRRGHTVAALVGLALGISLLALVPRELVVSPPYLFVSGFIASSAMILPGISGSFVLLVLGSYSFVLQLLTSISESLGLLSLFALGIILGLATMSHVVTYLFRRYKSATLYFLVGLVLGSLSIPIRSIMTNTATYSGLEWFLILFLPVLGGLIAGIIMVLGKRR